LEEIRKFVENSAPLRTRDLQAPALFESFFCSPSGNVDIRSSTSGDRGYDLSIDRIQDLDRTLLYRFNKLSIDK
jgi:hypothetical protein